MSECWICPARVFDGKEILTQSALRIVDDQIVDICHTSALPPSAIQWALPGLVTPGFVDLQVNGGGGVLLNTNPTYAGMVAIATAHCRFGTVAILPTLISDSREVLSKLVESVLQARGELGIAGLHLEGPHIALKKRGTHASKHIRSMDEFTINALEALVGHGVKTMITVAPEAISAQQIQRLVRLGVIVSLGHTNATSDMMWQAMDAGATCVTHLYNAMSSMAGRAPGAVGAAINSQAYVGIICDGHHVEDEMVGLAIRARPIQDRMILVSDAMPTVGGPDQFELYGQEIKLKDGRLINSEGALAGAHVTQLEGVKRLVEKTGTCLTTALRMAVSNPAACIGASALSTLVGRLTTDIIVLSDDLQLSGSLNECFADMCQKE